MKLQHPAEHDASPVPTSAPTPEYEPPMVEPLGSWRALTLQQSVPISGRVIILNPEDVG